MTLSRPLHRLLAAVALVAFAFGAHAQSRNEKPKNEYPNATRTEPKPKTSSAYEKLSKAYDELGKDEFDAAKVKQQLQDVLAAKRVTDYEKALSYRGLAQIAIEEDQIPQALEYSQQALDTNALDNKSHFDTLYLMAQIAINEERYEDSLKYVDEWFELTGAEKAEAYALKGNALYRLERYPDAATALKKAISMTDDPQPSWQQLLAATYEESGDTAGAAAAAEEVLKKDPNNKAAMLQLAQAYIDGEQTEKATALLDDAFKRGVIDDEKTLVYLASLFNDAEQPKRAAEVLEAAIGQGKVQPSLDNYKRLGNFHYEAEQIDQAIAAYAKGAALDPGGELDYQRGYLLIQEKEQVAEGKKALEAALAKGNFKQMGEAYILLGNAELEAGNEAAAIAAYKKAQGYPSSKSMADQMLKNFQR